jgi:hypothetical protein
LDRLKKLFDPKTVCRAPVRSKVLEKALNEPPLFIQSPAKWRIPEEPFSVPSRSKEPPQVNCPGPRFRVEPGRMERSPEVTRLRPFNDRTPPDKETPPLKVISPIRVRVPAVTTRSFSVLPAVLAVPVPVKTRVPPERSNEPLELSKLPPTETLAPVEDVNWDRVTGPLTVNKWVPREKDPSNWMNFEKVGSERAVSVPV